MFVLIKIPNSYYLVRDHTIYFIASSNIWSLFFSQYFFSALDISLESDPMVNQV